MPAAGLLLGLVSGVHCVGMCGGILAAFSAQNVVRVESVGRVVRAGHVVHDEGRPGPASPPWPLLLAFNGGRVAAYTLAGALAGSLGSAGGYFSGAIDLQRALYVLANLALVLIGLHLAGLGSLLARFEALGQPLWRLIRPLAARLLPADTLGRALLAGSLWGWLPCGLVYATLATAVASGSAVRGALCMLAFGLGTVPNLMLAGFALARLRRLLAHRTARLVAGGLVLSFGVLGLARAADIADAVRRVILCL